MSENLLNAALTAAERGWPVFPLRPGDKRPAGHAEARCPGTGRCAEGHRTPEQRATRDTATITAAWSAAPYNVGLATGPAGLLVVDLDLPKDDADTAPEVWAGMADGLDVFATLCDQAGERLPTETYTVRTRSGGQQLYFTAPEGKTLRSGAGVLGWKVDTRAWGGYVVAAGSIVGGRPYAVIHNAPPLPLPAWLSDLLTPQPLPAPMPITSLATHMRKTSAYLATAVEGELEKVQSAREGGRNGALYAAAYALARFIRLGDLTETAVDTDLTAAGLSVGLSPTECRTAIRSGLRRGGAGEEVGAA
ncbi:bifunctional DNA primase/polymerase [Streptomyces lunaelactis]|uniref:bifunctional DNA primase/polymerase n=1 Tax=Streptomyces lunaelactis TaxID=1535768 RepID=UPI001584F48C|nr:bifunctional DNA primase/polymerase [Streptomyces lunaelactis]NUK08663.1 bifunctional DNA primase/polymerase [Streptomyces lunaelactis]NUL10754.1 bifunctional DNA primase/polymerase [Streptomyces lunaelactis]NUL22580.1 bifunctional DNA primase/polymerase [Streptomyces lunaelactis]